MSLRSALSHFRHDSGPNAGINFSVRLSFLVIVALIFSCKQEDPTTSNDDLEHDRRPPRHTKEIEDLNPTTAIPSPEALDLQEDKYSVAHLRLIDLSLNDLAATRYLLDADEGEKDLFRRQIIEVSEESGLPISEVFSDILRMKPTISDGLSRCLRDTFITSPEDLVNGFLSGLEGRKRHFAIGGVTNKLRDLDDIVGLRATYEIVPPGATRGDVATALILEIAEQNGFEEALKQLDHLEYPEERSLASRRLEQYRDTPNR